MRLWRDPEMHMSTTEGGGAESTPRSSVIFREMTRDDIEAMLLRNNVGRLAFSFQHRVDIQPIHYVYEHGWLYGRTSEGDKIMARTHNQWVAFEVDRLHDVFHGISI